jgi:hypothetical protein
MTTERPAPLAAGGAPPTMAAAGAITAAADNVVNKQSAAAQPAFVVPGAIKITFSICRYDGNRFAAQVPQLARKRPFRHSSCGGV